MPLTLYVDGPAWRDQLRKTVAEQPEIIPVVKGNGYGFGISRLARRCRWLGVDTLAVGTYAEVPEVLDRFDGDVLVMEPYRDFLDAGLTHPKSSDRRVVHTIGRPADLTSLVTRSVVRPRIVVEALTSMGRHGLHADELAAMFADHAGATCEGLTLHLPLGAGHVREVEHWLTVLSPVFGRSRPGLPVLLSHVTDTELIALRERHPGIRLRPRIGTGLWLDDLSALSVRATVNDRHPVRHGDRIGYRQRRIGSDGWVLVLSGGTSHGIALEAPSPASTSRQRVVRLARGGLESTGRALSPFEIGGRRRWFIEPPHMQVSMVFVPDDVAVPEIGSEVPVNVRYTTTCVDRVVLS
jgi:Alanine racemase, N-terminal domain